MIRALLAAALAAAFALTFLSSALAESLGLGTPRIYLFTGLVVAMLLLACALEPRFSARGREMAMFLLALLLLQATLHPEAPFDPLDYKILLPLLLLLFAPNLARALAALDVAALLHAILALYVLASAAALALLEPSVLVRGPEAIARWDITGSMVVHSSLCLTYLLATLVRLRSCRHPLARALLLATAALALAMIFLAASRTTVATLLLFALLDVRVAAEPGRLRRWLAAALPASLAFAAYTLFVSDVLWRRLLGLGMEDYSSGRAHSVLYWLALAAGHPLGLGIGHVRRLLHEERPALDGGMLLEWPHNEPLRFWVEGGWIGLVFLLLLLLALMRRAAFVARRSERPLERTLALALAADILAQSLLQNYFNNVYQATMAVFVLAVLAERLRTRAPAARASAVEDQEHNLPRAA